MAAPISLVIPAYNRERFVGAAVRSVLAQTRRDFELIVWDDGSTDGTVAAAREAAGGDPRVRVVAGEHRGVSATLNAAIRSSGGAYVGWVDSDDGLAPEALAETAPVLDADPGIGMVYTKYFSTDANGRVRGVGKRCAIPYSRERLLVDFMTFHFRLIRRRVFDQVGGLDETAISAEDYDLCLRLSEVTEIRHVDKPLYFYRVHDDSESQAGRVRQILASRDAINRALQRRGMAETHELRVQIIGQFRLHRKPPGNDAETGAP
jgi:glycosyltransferase involved in cell wall biosynthesis